MVLLLPMAGPSGEWGLKWARCTGIIRILRVRLNLEGRVEQYREGRVDWKVAPIGRTVPVGHWG